MRKWSRFRLVRRWTPSRLASEEDARFLPLFRLRSSSFGGQAGGGENSVSSMRARLGRHDPDPQRMRCATARKSRTAERGYTLVELLVVLAILGMLAVIATPQVLHYLAGAKVSTAKTEVESIASALDLFKLDVGRYPTSQEGLAALLA